MLSSAIKSEPVERRREPRSFIDLPPIQIETESLTEKVRLINIASHGLLAHTRLQYEPGEALLVHFGVLPPSRARVAWWKRGMVGVTFAEKLEQSARDRLGLAPTYPDLISETAESRSNR